jgi:hypothetical protein
MRWQQRGTWFGVNRRVQGNRNGYWGKMIEICLCMCWETARWTHQALFEKWERGTFSKYTAWYVITTMKPFTLIHAKSKDKWLKCMSYFWTFPCIFSSCNKPHVTETAVKGTIAARNSVGQNPGDLCAAPTSWQAVCSLGTGSLHVFSVQWNVLFHCWALFLWGQRVWEDMNVFEPRRQTLPFCF